MSQELALLPSVTQVLAHPEIEWLVEELSRTVVLQWIREELERRRQMLLRSSLAASRESELETIVERIRARASDAQARQLSRVINATGVVLHTGLGRAQLSDEAISRVVACAQASNVELDLVTGKRSYRGFQLLSKLQALCGCEEALVVNNNAAATLLTLQALCAGREVIISRGQLIEIGGSYRLPDIFELSGAILREVGTTNRTRLEDYERAIGPDTAAILCVHPSNYRVVGFSETPAIEPLVELARSAGILAIDDIGSGCLEPMERYGLPDEPTFGRSIAAGADVVLGSGDKLLGGPQSGIIVGRKAQVDVLRNHPLARALRIDKLTLAALSVTLDAYLRGQPQSLPTFALLSATSEQLLQRARAIADQIGLMDDWCIDVGEDEVEVGGGSLPGAMLPTAVVRISHTSWSPDSIAARLRTGKIRVVPRIQRERVCLDLRSVAAEDDTRLALAVRLMAGHAGEA